MEYNFTYECKRPGLVFILCDLSKKMRIVEEQLQVAVKAIIQTYLEGCISGTNIKNRLFITLIGYGNGTPHIIQEGWAKEWAPTLVNAHTKNEQIVREQLKGSYGCESVWELVKNEIKEAVDYFLNNESYYGLASPHIINITNRKPSNNKKCEGYINEIKSLKDYYCGKIPNIMISTIILLDKYDNSSDILFINREKKYNSSKVNFWKNVVSEVPIELLIDQGIDFAEEYQPVSCCTTHNVKGCSLYAWSTFGS